jgi:hypothetical protein
MDGIGSRRIGCRNRETVVKKTCGMDSVWGDGYLFITAGLVVQIVGILTREWALEILRRKWWILLQQ